VRPGRTRIPDDKALPQIERLLDAGLSMLLEHGYNDLGIHALLEATGTPKGSFYHHFKDKEDFALQVIDQYMRQVHTGLDVCLGDEARRPLERVRWFFESTQQAYREQGYMGCLLGGLGQELSGESEVFRRKIEECFSEIARRISVCMEKARTSGDIPSGEAAATAAFTSKNCSCSLADACCFPLPRSRMLTTIQAGFVMDA